MLRQEMIRLAHKVPELRVHLLPLIKQAKSFEDAVKGKTFRNPETGNRVLFESLPSEEQKRIRSQWVKKNPRGSGGDGDDPKEMLKEDSDKYFAQHISGAISKKSLSDALKDTEWKPRGKGTYHKSRGFVELWLDHKEGNRSRPLRVTFSGSHYTKGDGDGEVSLEGRHGSDDEVFELTCNPDADAKEMHKALKELVDRYQEYDKAFGK